ncbi:hypothetical protein CBL_02662 [Carabus blaptoides fortunei]
MYGQIHERTLDTELREPLISGVDPMPVTAQQVILPNLEHSSYELMKCIMINPAPFKILLQVLVLGLRGVEITRGSHGRHTPLLNTGYLQVRLHNVIKNDGERNEAGVGSRTPQHSHALHTSV